MNDQQVWSARFDAYKRVTRMAEELNKVVEAVQEIQREISLIIDDGLVMPSPLQAILMRGAGQWSKIATSCEGEEIGEHKLDDHEDCWMMAKAAFEDAEAADLVQYDFWDTNGEHAGALLWTCCNDGVEQLVDYTCSREGSAKTPLESLIDHVCEDYSDD